ncbi:MAG: PilZ domain-containing protein [Candidatus Saccharibacteria bacterium]
MKLLLNSRQSRRLFYAFLIAASCIALSQAVALGEPLNWEYKELPDSYNEYMDRNNYYATTYVYPLLALAAFMGLGYFLFKLGKSDRELSDLIFPKPYTLKVPYKLTRPEPSERRLWIRVPIHNALFWAPFSDEEPDDDALKFEKVVSDNLSGGGCKFNTFATVNHEDTIRLIIPLSDREKLWVSARVVRVIASERKTLPNSIAATFTGISDSERDRLVSFIFNHQREMLQRKKREELHQCLRCGEPIALPMRGQEKYCPKCKDLLH